MCELLALPAEYLELLCTILRQIELGQPWPKQWRQAFVVLLPKPDADSTSPSGLRPITILSRVYRTWARTHTLQILRWASRFAAPLIGGGVRGIDPTVLMMHVSFLIEQATKEEPLHGLVVDIRKCFNSIHRGLILAALRKFGIPEYIINPYSNLMKNFERVFVFDGFVSDCQTNTGVPEGCPLAVVAMLFVTLSMYHYMHSTCPDTIVYAFADNWSLLNGSTGPLKQAISCFEHFCDLFKLPLAGDKSWLWSTEQSGRKELVGIVLQGQPVPIKHQERELGFDMTYTKKVSKKVFKTRILKTHAKLRKIRQCGVAKIHKPRLVRASAVVVPNGCELRSLCAATAKAIGAGRFCESPYLSLMLTGKDNLDPEFNIVLNALRTLRRLFCMPSYPKQQFLNMVNKPGARPGPAASLSKNLKKWKLILKLSKMEL